MLEKTRYCLIPISNFIRQHNGWTNLTFVKWKKCELEYRHIF